MIIKFKKGKEKTTFHCIRKDGSTTWTAIHQGMEIHDLAHFVVETELGFYNAFYGLLIAGYSIQDFELPRAQRPEALLPKNLSEEALQTEHIVNLLQVQYREKIGDFNLIDQLKSILKEHNISFPEKLNHAKASILSKRVHDLMTHFNRIKEGEVLELQFDLV